MYICIYILYVYIETVSLYETSTQGQNYACYHWNGTEYPGFYSFTMISYS